MLIGRMLKKSDFWALLFGMVMILIIFGDSMPNPHVGNLDTIFGNTFWRALDVIYLLASIAIFLLHGRSKGRLKINLGSAWPLIVFLAAAVMIQLDDFFVVFGHPITLPNTYWTIARWLYFFIAMSTFLAFGSACEKNVGQRELQSNSVDSEQRGPN
jgi:hypothetical protein